MLDEVDHRAPLVDNPNAWVASKIEQQERVGFSPWAVQDRASGRILGFCGLFVREPYGITLGYAILPEVRGHGLATEAADAALTWAEEHGLDVHASIRPPNPASERVLNKIGMRLHDRQRDEDGERLVFRRHPTYRDRPKR